MSFCNSNCAVTVPTAVGSGCAPTTRKGGIKKLVFASCDVEFSDVTDLAEWADFIAHDKIHATGDILGNIPEASFEEKKIASCLPQYVTGGTNTIDFSDYNADLTDAGEVTFYNTIMTNQRNMIVGYTDCDDNFYGFIGSFTMKASAVREEDVKGNTFIKGTITYESLTMIVPVNIPGLNLTLE